MNHSVAEGLNAMKLQYSGTQTTNNFDNNENSCTENVN
jgi:hypothetical protein